MELTCQLSIMCQLFMIYQLFIMCQLFMVCQLFIILMNSEYVRNMTLTILLTSYRCIFLLFTLLITSLLNRL